MTESRPVGRPQHEPNDVTRNQVSMMAAFGNTEEQISQIVGISEPTLRRHYRAELDFGRVKANNMVAMNMFRQATKDDVRAARWAEFWLRCRAGWSEYAPPPAPKPAKVGKKEQANIDAKTAGEGTEWSELVRH